MNANGNLTVNSDETETVWMVLTEAIDWDGAEEYRPRSIGGDYMAHHWAQEEVARREEAETFRPTPVWRSRVVSRTTRKVVTYSEV